MTKGEETRLSNLLLKQVAEGLDRSENQWMKRLSEKKSLKAARTGSEVAEISYTSAYLPSVPGK